MEGQRTPARASGHGRPRDGGLGEARVAAMVRAHGDALRRVARRYSADPADAEDALQRALEIYLRRLARVEPATELAWLKVVVIRTFVHADPRH
jgi:DNA-directed RNA polymerase specialized sigma24 family protein